MGVFAALFFFLGSSISLATSTGNVLPNSMEGQYLRSPSAWSVGQELFDEWPIEAEGGPWSFEYSLGYNPDFSDMYRIFSAEDNSKKVDYVDRSFGKIIDATTRFSISRFPKESGWAFLLNSDLSVEAFPIDPVLTQLRALVAQGFGFSLGYNWLSHSTGSVVEKGKLDRSPLRLVTWMTVGVRRGLFQQYDSLALLNDQFNDELPRVRYEPFAMASAMTDFEMFRAGGEPFVGKLSLEGLPLVADLSNKAWVFRVGATWKYLFIQESLYPGLRVQSLDQINGTSTADNAEGNSGTPLVSGSLASYDFMQGLVYGLKWTNPFWRVRAFMNQARLPGILAEIDILKSGVPSWSIEFGVYGRRPPMATDNISPLVFFGFQSHFGSFGPKTPPEAGPAPLEVPASLPPRFTKEFGSTTPDEASTRKSPRVQK